MGWPIRGKPFQQPPATPAAWVQEARLYPPTLDVVRHAAQVYGVLHAYHRAVTDVDNDLFFRIGLLVDQTSLTERVRDTLETEARQFLSIQPPLILDIRLIMLLNAFRGDSNEQMGGIGPKVSRLWLPGTQHFL
jgi:hypothetical protein